MLLVFLQPVHKQELSSHMPEIIIFRLRNKYKKRSDFSSVMALNITLLQQVFNC